MKRTNYLYAMVKYLTSLFTFIPSNPETTKGYTAKPGKDSITKLLKKP